MRPTREATDLEFWSNAATYWKERAEHWFLVSAKLDKEDAQWASQQEDRARENQFRAELAHQEAQGLILVYTGRANPRWA